MNIPLQKKAQEAAEVLLHQMTDPTRQERQEDGRTIIEIVGNWQALDSDELDIWGGRLKFVVRENEATTEEERIEREKIARSQPALAPFATSKALLTVYKAGLTNDSWEDVTREFAQKASRYAYEQE